MAECSRLQADLDAEKKRADEAASHVKSQKRADRKGAVVVRCEIETQYTQHEEKLNELQSKLDQVGNIDVYMVS